MDCREMILSDAFFDILLDYPPDLAKAPDVPIPNCVLQLDENFRILYLERENIAPLSILDYQYAYVPKCYALTRQPVSRGQPGNAAVTREQQNNAAVTREQQDKTAVTREQSGKAQTMQAQVLPLSGAYEDSGILAMQEEPFHLTGRGILIGLIDTGIRYRLPQFRRDDGTSKIAAIWDQTDQSGTAPEGLVYGTMYLQEQINRALSEEGTETIAHTDESGHGTKVASVALNAAPDAELVVVKCRTAKPNLKQYYGIPQSAEAYAESDIMTALNFLEYIRNKEQKPMVICITMGTNMGSHTSSSLLGRYLALLGNRKQRCVVIGGGNEGNSAHHFAGNIRTDEAYSFEDVEIRVSERVSGFSMEIWGSVPNSYTIAVTAPDGEQAQRIPIRYGMERNLFFVYSRTSVRVRYLLTESGTGRPLILLRFQNPSAGIWTVRVFAGGENRQAPFHAWLPVDAFLEKPVYFLRPEPLLTMTEPSYSMNAIGLTYYNAANNSFAPESGRGGIAQVGDVPSLSAAGVDVQTVLGRETGSSISAALMAGAAAQLMQWGILQQQDFLLDSTGIRNLFIRGAQRDPGTEYPNPTWGYGRMNIEGVFEKLISEI